MAKGVLSKLPAAFTAQEPTPGLAHGAEATSLIPMSRRMQVLFEEAEFRRMQAADRACGQTLAE
jgi:hypothetical protein